MHTFDVVVPSREREPHAARTAAAVPSIAGAVPAMTPGDGWASQSASSQECTRLLQRFVLDPAEMASVARIDSAELMRLYRAGVDRRIAEAGVGRPGAARRPLATLGPEDVGQVDVLPGVGSSRPIQMGIAALSVAATVTTIVSAALCAISSLMRHKPV